MSRQRLEIPRQVQNSGQIGPDLLSQYDHDPFEGLGDVKMLRMDRALNGSSHNHTNEDHESWVNSRVFKIQGVNISEAQKPAPRKDYHIDLNNFEAFRNYGPSTQIKDSNVVQAKGPVRAFQSSAVNNKPYQNEKKEDSLIRVLEQADFASQQQLAMPQRYNSGDGLPSINLGDIEHDFRNIHSKEKGQLEKTVWAGTDSWKNSGGAWATEGYAASGHNQLATPQRSNNTGNYSSTNQYQGTGVQSTANFGKQISGPGRNSQQQINFKDVEFSD